ncbi:hypothetical protein KBD59_00405 [Candidatus Gracilibacteria bacterium]|nr:hypothetical protein [Candidatus Gracilibacteria bacterium]
MAYPGGGKKFGGFQKKSGFGFGGRDRDADRSVMHKTTCSECGMMCEVPFKPNGKKPVLCNACFKQSDRGDAVMHRATCSSCGNQCEVPFRPSGQKPIFCQNCFGKNPSRNTGGPLGGGGMSSSPSSSMSKEQFEILNAKLDRIMKALIKPSDAAPMEKAEDEKPAFKLKPKGKRPIKR